MSGKLVVPPELHPTVQSNVHRQCQQIGVLLFNGFSNHCLANTIEPLRAANSFARRTIYRWQFLTLDGSVAVSSSGLPVVPDAALPEATSGDWLLLLPSYGFRSFTSSALLSALCAAAARFRRVGGLDTGAWLMAAAGLLEERRATIHWDERVSFAEAFPRVSVCSERIVVDECYMTCGGANTAFELMLEMIQRRHGVPLRIAVANLFMVGDHRYAAVPPSPDGNEERRGRSASVNAAIALMHRHLESPLPLIEVARQIGLSQRVMEKRFQRELGMQPRAVYRVLRLDEAMRLTDTTFMPVSEIAVRCGYEDASAMTRAFRRRFGSTPRAIRAGGVKPMGVAVG